MIILELIRIWFFTSVDIIMWLYELFAVLFLAQYSLAGNQYQVMVKRMDKCKEAVPPYTKNNDTELTITMYSKNNKNFIKGTWRSKDDLKGYSWRFKYGREQNGVIQYSYEYDKISCRNIIPKLVLMAARIRYDAKNCVFYKGNYTFDNLDLSKIDKGVFVFPAREVGESVIMFSLHSDTETLYCYMILMEYL